MNHRREKSRLRIERVTIGGSKAFKFEPWREFVASMDDIQVAYNLDGGDSAFMYFNGKKINDALTDNDRLLADIVYFASAWSGE